MVPGSGLGRGGQGWGTASGFPPPRALGLGPRVRVALLGRGLPEPPGRAGGGPDFYEAGPYPGFEEPQNQMFEWGGLSALFICR